MRLIIAAVGRLKRGPERDLAERYRERAATAGRALGIRGIDVAEINESRASRAPDRCAEEAADLARFLPENAAIVVLDERGQSTSSVELARAIEQWRDQGRDTAFVIGGADGIAPSLAARADRRLAFGSATWPHQLARIMLLEQLYRAMTILAGHPYHRG